MRRLLAPHCSYGFRLASFCHGRCSTAPERFLQTEGRERGWNGVRLERSWKGVGLERNAVEAERLVFSKVNGTFAEPFITGIMEAFHESDLFLVGFFRLGAFLGGDDSSP
jgi:hypothetical protein